MPRDEEGLAQAKLSRIRYKSGRIYKIPGGISAGKKTSRVPIDVKWQARIYPNMGTMKSIL